MNDEQKARLVRVAEWLEASAPTVGKISGFNLGEVIEPAEYSHAVQNDGSAVRHSCGTVCCIAGAIVQFELQERFGEMADVTEEVYGSPICTNRSVLDTAAELVGIREKNVAYNLFVPGVALGRVTPAQAAKVVRNLIETGEVNWNEVSKIQDFEDGTHW